MNTLDGSYLWDCDCDREPDLEPEDEALDKTLMLSLWSLSLWRRFRP